MVVVKMCGAGRKKKARLLGEPFSICASLVDLLNRGYIVCTRPFFALSSLEINLLVLIEICVTCSFHFRVVDEQIIAAVIGSNKTITFVCIKPFYCS
jgi:hypothetical protein